MRVCCMSHRWKFGLSSGQDFQQLGERQHSLVVLHHARAHTRARLKKALNFLHTHTQMSYFQES